jgi:hypothetical protein
MRLDHYREVAGELVGRMGAPVVAAISFARSARMFHPEGHVYAGTATALPGRFEDLGRDLAGSVLARLSGALWRGGRERLDVLGYALRFRGRDGVLDHVARPGDTDLLTATIRSPWTMPLSPLFTNAHDFLANRYWAVSPFEHATKRFELRLVPVDPRRFAGPRADRLAQAVAAGRAVWRLEARPTLHLRWIGVARIELTRALAIDQEALRFDPFRGVLRPVGFVHAIRRAVYAASQAARPREGRASGPDWLQPTA